METDERKVVRYNEEFMEVFGDLDTILYWVTVSRIGLAMLTERKAKEKQVKFLRVILREIG